MRRFWQPILAFLEDFYPAQWGQLLFFGGAFFLYASSGQAWLSSTASIMLGLSEAPFPWSRLEVIWLLSNYLLLLASAACVAIAVVRGNHKVRKFFIWSVIPALLVLGLWFFPLLWLRSKHPSMFDSGAELAGSAANALPAVFHNLGLGFYFWVIGIGLLGAGMWRHRQGLISLPVTFRGEASREELSAETLNAGRNLMLFLLFILCAPVVPGVLEGVLFLLLDPSTLRREYNAGDLVWWVESNRLVFAAVMAGGALFAWGRNCLRETRALVRFAPVRDFVWALGLPFIVFAAPRLAVYTYGRCSAYFHWSRYEFGVPFGEVFGWPPPWVAILLPAAFLHELGWRGLFQAEAVKRFGFKRGVFFVGMMWGLLATPFKFSVATGRTAWFINFPLCMLGAIAMATCFAWLFARSSSILPVAVMHWALIALAQGTAQTTMYQFPVLSLFQLGIWCAIPFLLFRRYPLLPLEAMGAVPEGQEPPAW